MAAGRPSRSELYHLGEIYRAGPKLRSRGREAFRASLRAGYRETLDALTSARQPPPRFSANFLRRLRDWDDLVGRYIAGGGNGDGAWKRGAARSLKRKGYDEKLIDDYLKAVSTNTDFIRRYGFLFR